MDTQRNFTIEKVFLIACGFKTSRYPFNPEPKKPQSKDVLFDALSAVVSLLYTLDGVKNILNFSKILEQENGEPVYSLKSARL
jgi:hypothetical protein|tara:strand:+ start:271 stop:519 length:249 start_codon:yes stop_codon:yes gene_type:complete